MNDTFVVAYDPGDIGVITAKGVAYAGATTGTKAREEITKILQRFGCESVDFMDDYAKAEVLLAFVHRGRQVQLRASAKGWAALYLKARPWTYTRRTPRPEIPSGHAQQGHIAVNSLLRDCIKGQVTA